MYGLITSHWERRRPAEAIETPQGRSEVITYGQFKVSGAQNGLRFAADPVRISTSEFTPTTTPSRQCD